MKNVARKGFTLIEVIVATSILTIAVFGVFKLIGENNKILSTSQNIKNSHLLLQPFVGCMDAIGKNQLSTMGNTIYIDLGEEKNRCEANTTPTLVEINNLEYQLIANKAEETTNHILWNLVISGDGNMDIEVSYLQK